MSASAGESQSNKVVSLFDTSGARRPSSTVVPEKSAHTGKVLVLASRFPFYASIEVNDLPWVRVQFSARSRDLVVAAVRKILCQEFGRKRVTRTGYQFAIQHRKADLLIASLLRAQFYTNQIVLPEYNLMGERVEQNGVRVIWGVGRNPEQACQDRIRKRKARLPGML